ncbi:hypothetical protein GCM10010357_34490 [Streptomyces luteireticuli]|uniref:Uncharacterized protein n=1 Tax=Streptomyces luteireticuli TaxID=173858 RepID=A0ABP3IM65_9ACTN
MKPESFPGRVGGRRGVTGGVMGRAGPRRSEEENLDPVRTGWGASSVSRSRAGLVTPLQEEFPQLRAA